MSKLNPHILVVDDDDLLCEAVCEFFKIYDYGIAVGASCSDQAFECTKREHFDLIITGISQPGMDSLEMTALIRRMSVPPVIVMTGYYSSEVRRLAYKNGAKAFLRKPFLWERLERAVHVVIAHGIHFVGSVETNS